VPLLTAWKVGKEFMKISFHPHALERMIERGTTEDEVRAAIEG